MQIISNVRIEIKVDEVARKAEIHAQQLVAMQEIAHRERKYHDDGNVCNILENIFPVLTTDDVMCSIVYTDDATSVHCACWIHVKVLLMVTQQVRFMQQR